MTRVGLRSIFVNDGIQVDPVGVSAVTIFTRADMQSALGTATNNKGLVSGTPLMQFANINPDGGLVSSVHSASFLPSQYNPTSTGGNCSLGNCGSVSGVYRTGPGELVVVLDGTLALSGIGGLGGSSTSIKNGASAVNDYVDIWTVKLSQDSEWQVLVNEFSLFGDTFFSITQPLTLRTRNSLVNKRIVLGSKIKLKIPTEITVENKDIDSSITNIFKESAITSGAVEITKLNEEISLPSRVVVEDFAETSSLVDVTSDNTLLFTWDTANLQERINSLGGGAATGTYTLRVMYSLVDEVIISPRFPFIVS